MVPCPLCGNDVEWVTVTQASQLLGVDEQVVRKRVRNGEFPGAWKDRPGNGIAALWKLPIKSVIAHKEARA